MREVESARSHVQLARGFLRDAMRELGRPEPDWDGAMRALLCAAREVSGASVSCARGAMQEETTS